MRRGLSGSRPTVGRLSRACLAGSLWQAGRLAGNFARRLAAAARPIDSRASGPARVKPFVDSRYRRRAGRAETKVELCTLLSGTRACCGPGRTLAARKNTYSWNVNWQSGWPLVWKTWKCQGFWQLSVKCQGFSHFTESHGSDREKILSGKSGLNGTKSTVNKLQYHWNCVLCKLYNVSGVNLNVVCTYMGFLPIYLYMLLYKFRFLEPFPVSTHVFQGGCKCSIEPFNPCLSCFLLHTAMYSMLNCLACEC